MTAMMTSSIFLGPLVNNFSPFPHRVLESPLPSSAPSFTRIRSPKATATPVVTHHPAPFATALPKKKVLVPVGLGTEEMEAVIVVDVLRRAGADVLLASVEKGLEIEGSSGIKLVADVFVTSCISEVFDLIALPGGMPGSARLRDSLVLKQITSRHANGKRLFGAICAAPAVVLEPWGLMKRKQMTCHPAFMHKLPSFRAVKSSIQVSGELTTSRGPGTACEFAVSLVQQLFGDLHAAEVKEKLTNTGLKNEEFGSIDWSMDHIPQVLVPVANGSEEMEVVTIVDILRRANVNVLVASIEKTTQITASQNTMIVADTLIDATLDSTFDMIILPGGLTGSTRLQKSKFLKKLLKEQKSGGRICGAIGSSTAILQKQGLLMNKTVVAHPSIIGTSKIKLSDEDIGVIIDGKVITSRGLGTAIDFSLAILYKLFGHARARSVAEALVYEYPRR